MSYYSSGTHCYSIQTYMVKQAILAEEHTLILSERLLQRLLSSAFFILECLELVEFDHALIILEPVYGTKAILFGTHSCYIKTNDACIPV